MPEASGGPEPVVYALCKGNLDSLEVLPPRDPAQRFHIVAQLGADATLELAHAPM